MVVTDRKKGHHTVHPYRAGSVMHKDSADGKLKAHLSINKAGIRMFWWVGDSVTFVMEYPVWQTLNLDFSICLCFVLSLNFIDWVLMHGSTSACP